MRRLLLMTLVLFVSTSARAFNAMGHRTLAALAWHKLALRERAALDEILRAHPAADKWEADRQRYSSTLDPAEYRFLRASDWPDSIKHTHEKGNHPPWHYANYPLEGPTSPVQPDPGAKHNILAGLAQNEETLADTASPPKVRAVALAWVIHLLGDLHQPLHLATAITAANPAPEGDAGGNATVIRVKGKVKLHAFWDDLFGKSRDPDDAERTAVELESRGVTPAGSRGDEASWALESRRLAQTVAYPRETWAISEGDEIPVDGSYVSRAKATGEQQIVTGAARLVAVLRRTVLARPSTTAPGTRDSAARVRAKALRE